MAESAPGSPLRLVIVLTTHYGADGVVKHAIDYQFATRFRGAPTFALLQQNTLWGNADLLPPDAVDAVVDAAEVTCGCKQCTTMQRYVDQKAENRKATTSLPIIVCAQLRAKIDDLQTAINAGRALERPSAKALRLQRLVYWIAHMAAGSAEKEKTETHLRLPYYGADDSVEELSAAFERAKQYRVCGEAARALAAPWIVGILTSRAHLVVLAFHDAAWHVHGWRRQELASLADCRKICETLRLSDGANKFTEALWQIVQNQRAAVASGVQNSYARRDITFVDVQGQGTLVLGDLKKDGDVDAAKDYTRRCAKCQQVGAAAAPLRRCARCHRVLYCSPACQRADWPAHRSVCAVATVAGIDASPK